jgi:hypothetical protein
VVDDGRVVVIVVGRSELYAWWLSGLVLPLRVKEVELLFLPLIYACVCWYKREKEKLFVNKGIMVFSYPKYFFWGGPCPCRAHKWLHPWLCTILSSATKRVKRKT